MSGTKGDALFKMDVYDVKDRPVHFHDHAELLYVMEGSLRLTDGEQRTEMRAEDVCIINAMQPHAVSHINRALVCVLSLDPALFANYSSHPLFWCNSVKDGDHAYDELRRMLQQLLLEHISHQPDQNLQRNGLMYMLLHFLVSHFMVDKVASAPQSREEKSAERIAKITAYLSRHYAEPLSLQEMADHFYLSKAYLSKYFKKKFQMNFMEYLNQLRLRHATEELLYTDKPVTRVALDNGFASSAAFNKLFQEANGMPPSVYRREKCAGPQTRQVQQQEDAAVRRRLMEHFQLERRQEIGSASERRRIAASTAQAAPYKPLWNRMMNLGAAKLLLQSDVLDILAMSKRELGFEYVRIWSLFSPELRMVRHETDLPYNFGVLDTVIDSLLQLGLRPFLELGELPDRILTGTSTAIRPSQNVTQFRCYDEFVALLEGMIAHLVSHYGMHEVEQWIFELWDDHRVEVYADKRPYQILYRDVERILHNHAPGALLGGAGNRMGWHRQNTDTSIRRWIDEGIYPAFISYNYYPYATINISSEEYTKLKTDDNDFLQTLTELRRTMVELGFPPRKLFITDWNSTVSQRNPLNDSCWKGCYILKNCFAVLDQLDLLAYSQLSDIPGDYSDVPGILGGMAGLISRDGIRKPAYYAFAFLNKLQPLLLSRSENAFVTWDGGSRYSMIVHNYKARSYLYYYKRQDSLSLDELYQYFENMDNLRLDVELTGLENGVYVLRRSRMSRKYGSVLDEWQQMECFTSLRREDIRYLQDICTPHVTIATYQVTDGKLVLPNDLQPLEMVLLELTKEE